MKKNIFLYTFIGLVVFLGTSCRDEDKYPIPDWNKHVGAMAVATVNQEKAFFNYFEISEGEVEFELTYNGFDVTKVDKIDVQLNYFNKLEGTLYESRTVRTVTSFPAVVNITSADAAQAFGKALEDIGPGDTFTATFLLHTSDGKILGGTLYSADLCAQEKQPGTCSLFFPVACPSFLPTEGTWTGVTTQGTFGAYGINENVTITALGNGNYALSDVSGGFYANFGFNLNQPADVIDVCNDVSVTRIKSTTQFSIVANGAGTWDEETETLTIPWCDADFGFCEVTILTRNMN